MLTLLLLLGSVACTEAVINSYKFDQWSKCYFGAYDVTNHAESKRCDHIIMTMRKSLMDIYRKDGYDWKEDFDIGLAKAEADWVNSLLYKHSKHRRTKRQATQSGPSKAKPRKEVRMMSLEEWGNFTLAVNSLKYEKIPGSSRNKYDTIANIIRSNPNSTMNGPGFLGFNRAYIELFERALQELIPDITVPYWDSTKDFYMDDPKESVLWTWMFFGDGNGFVHEGPFANWTGENGDRLFREVGENPSSLFTLHGLEAIFARKNHFMITLPQPTDLTKRFTIEGQQNGVHAWVGGQMHMRELSAQDPVFFMHRAFVDYIWNKFIEKSGADPGSDYPTKGGEANNPENTMHYFSQNTNRDGYKLDSLYEDSPQCNSTHKSCGSVWLKCTYFWKPFKKHLCVSVTRGFC
uniref:Tyrosinase-like protein n=1 Tax=Pinctada maxima TaxID=104660 RepID=A0A8U0BZL2_PINMA|nr:tyrosinase-like protein [Pinctada maxima]